MMKKEKIHGVYSFDDFERDILEFTRLYNETEFRHKYNVKLSQICRPRKFSQYINHIYWYELIIKKEARKKLKSNYQHVIGLHIKPYRISLYDVDKAQKSSIDNFNEAIESGIDDFVDYDVNSANYHKVSNGEYQVIMIEKVNGKRKGPGWRNNIVGSVKTDWYYPNIDEDKGNNFIESQGEYIFNLVKEVLMIIFEDEHLL